MEKRSSVLARLFAILALVAAVATVIVVISGATSEDSHRNGGGGARHRSGQVKHETAKKRPTAATYTVKSGDTLTAIAHSTGLTVAELLALNPEVDPQILIAGQTLKLK
jgi:LysM repeat protein